jgi:hypothetical protein
LGKIHSIMETGLKSAINQLNPTLFGFGPQITEDALNRIKNTEIPSYPAFLKVSFEDVDVLYRGRSILHEDQFEDLGQPPVMGKYETMTAQFYSLFYENLNFNVLTGYYKDKAQNLLGEMRKSAKSLRDYSIEKASHSSEGLKASIKGVLDLMSGYSSRMSAIFKSNPKKEKSDNPIFYSMTPDSSLPSNLSQPMNFDDFFLIFEKDLRAQIKIITEQEASKWFWLRKTEHQIFEEALKEIPVDKQLREDPQFGERLKSITPQ